MKFFVSALILGFSVHASAGLFDSVPEATVKRLYKIAKSDNLEKFSNALEGDARTEFGNAEGLTLLRSDLAKGKLSTRDGFLYDKREDDQDYLVYRVDVSARKDGVKNPVRSFETTCLRTWRLHCNGERGFRSCDYEPSLKCTITDIAE